MNVRTRGYYTIEDDRDGIGWVELHGHMRLRDEAEDSLIWELVEYGLSERFPLSDDLSWLEEELEYQMPEPGDRVDYLTDTEAADYHEGFLDAADEPALAEAYLPPSALHCATPCGRYYFGKEASLPCSFHMRRAGLFDGTDG